MIGECKMLIRNAAWLAFYPPAKSANQRVKCCLENVDRQYT